MPKKHKLKKKKIYLPPFLGGVADEIFLLEVGHVRTLEDSPNRFKLGRFKSKSDDIKKPEVFVPWVRVQNVPPELRMPMYKIFSKLGLLKCLRTYDNCIYLLYETPEQAEEALIQDRRVFPFKKITLNPLCDNVTASDIEELDKEHNMPNYDYVNEIKVIYELNNEDDDSDVAEEPVTALTYITRPLYALKSKLLKTANQLYDKLYDKVPAAPNWMKRIWAMHVYVKVPAIPDWMIRIWDEFKTYLDIWTPVVLSWMKRFDNWTKSQLDIYKPIVREWMFRHWKSLKNKLKERIVARLKRRKFKHKIA